MADGQQVRVIDLFGFDITDRIVGEFGSVDAFLAEQQRWAEAWQAVVDRYAAEIDRIVLGDAAGWRPTGIRNGGGGD